MSTRPESEHVGPSARFDVLRRRAELLRRTRAFFAERGVLEVETPLLATGLVVDAHIEPIVCGDIAGTEATPQTRYLLPSPEAPMKRLLAAGAGPIYQISKAFRQGERGRLHQPEFTMLEWYRPGLPYGELMDEVGELLRALLGIAGWVKRTHRDVFHELLGVDSRTATADQLATVAHDRGVAFSQGVPSTGAGEWLDLLFATCIEPQLDPDVATFIYDFPASQSALATLSADDPAVAQRFELIYRGMELCNGYQELLDADLHRERFAAANGAREQMGKTRIHPDEQLIAAIERGLPTCSGVAVGFDRVAMIACGAPRIDDVLAFPA